MTDVLSLLENQICVGVARKIRGAGQGCSGGLKQRKAEECGPRTIRAEEELRRAQLKYESLTTILREHKAKKNLQREELNGMAVFQKSKTVK